MKVALVYPNLDGSPQSLDMGVVYIATYLDERTKHQVKIIDTTFHRRHWQFYIKEQIQKFNPDVIGISIVSLYFDYAQKIAQKIKEYHHVPIIVGGFQAIMAPEKTILVKEFDALCTGEGEFTLQEYLDVLEDKGDLRMVKGLWFKENGKVLKNTNREYNPDLDLLPIPNYDLFDDLDKYLYYLQRLYVIGTRGCPYRCSFCAESVLHQFNPGKRFRERQPQKYVQEIAYLYNKYWQRGMRAAHLYDSVFTFNDAWFKEWIDEYKKLALHKVLPYSVFLKADRHNASEEKIRLLAESGCLQVRIGIESGDDEMREHIINKKGSSNNVAIEIINQCSQYGLIVKTYCILGIPGDSRESMLKTYNYCNRPSIHIPLFFSYTPLPNTPLAQRVMMMNGTDSAEIVYSFHYSKGAKNKGVPHYFVPYLILKSYIYFGARLAWNTFLSNPFTFLGQICSRIFWGFIYGCPLILTAGYALISPLFWPNLAQRIKRIKQKKL